MSRRQRPASQLWGRIAVGCPLCQGPGQASSDRIDWKQDGLVRELVNQASERGFYDKANSFAVVGEQIRLHLNREFPGLNLPKGDAVRKKIGRLVTKFNEGGRDSFDPETQNALADLCEKAGDHHLKPKKAGAVAKKIRGVFKMNHQIGKEIRAAAMGEPVQGDRRKNKFEVFGEVVTGAVTTFCNSSDSRAAARQREKDQAHERAVLAHQAGEAARKEREGVEAEARAERARAEAEAQKRQWAREEEKHQVWMQQQQRAQGEDPALVLRIAQQDSKIAELSTKIDRLIDSLEAGRS